MEGEVGLPADYPKPMIENLMFYIQRNDNTNTVLYTLNINENGLLDSNNPLKVFWKRYFDQGELKDLNMIQRKLAYGYNALKRRKDYYEFSLAAYADKKMFLRKYGQSYKVITKVNGMWAKLDNIYVFTESLGVFPKVKFAEIYGSDLRYGLPVYEKLSFNY